jgi:predicted nucleotidyltransferase
MGALFFWYVSFLKRKVHNPLSVLMYNYPQYKQEGRMVDIELLKHEIIERLKPLNVEKVILFGSYAYGTPNEDSDIDLYVVTKDDFIPQSFREKMDVVRKVSIAIDDIRNKTAVDLIVHTKSMANKFKDINSSFSRELLNKGIVLL